MSGLYSDVRLLEMLTYGTRIEPSKAFFAFCFVWKAELPSGNDRTLVRVSVSVEISTGFARFSN